MNKVILMGRLTKDVELKRSGDTVIGKFTIAVDRRNKNKDTDFISCVAWKGTAEFIKKYFGKGSMIAVVGRIQTGSYEKDGEKRYTTDIMIDEAFFTGEKKSEEKDAFDGFTPADDEDDLSWA